MDLEFRKYLTNYGISLEEYKNMDETQKKELINKFEKETRQDSLGKVGKGLQGAGCLIILVPILLILLIFFFALIKSLF